MSKCHLVVYDNPDEALKSNIEFIEELRKTKGFKVYQEVFRHLCKTDLWFLAKYVMGFWWLDNDLHGRELLRFTVDNWDSDQGRGLPRGHVKTLWSCTEMVNDILNDPLIGLLCSTNTDTLCTKIGRVVGNTLLYNKKLQECFGDILPEKKSDAEEWGSGGYTIPFKSRNSATLEPTLMLRSVGSSVTGFHPHKCYFDDLTESHNCNPIGHEKIQRFIDNCLRLCTVGQRVFRWNFTRWSDADPAGKMLEGEILGPQGKFQHMVKSCFIDDDPKLGCIFPEKVRWGMETLSGFNHELLLTQMSVKDRKSRAFFSCQMRNNPVPEEEQIVKVEDIVIYESEDTPKFGRVRKVGVEVTGGGLPIFNHLKERIREVNMSMPLEEITGVRTPGVTKADHIGATLEPISRQGRFHARRWMIPLTAATDNLGYELKMLGAAKHEDVADAFHIIAKYLSKGHYPREPEPAHLYIGVDLAYSEKKRSDYTVFAAACIDSKQNFWALDYDRFQATTPTVICTRLISFFLKLNDKGKSPRRRGGKNKNRFATSHSVTRTSGD
jgi:hypothetical protein